MNTRILISRLHLIASPWFFLACCASSVRGVTISGPITASAVTVSGDVTISSMTASSMTVTNEMSILGMLSGIPGRVLQMKISSSTVATSISTTTWTAVSSIAQSIALRNANDYVRVQPHPSDLWSKV